MKNYKHLEQHQQTAITNTFEFDYLSGVFRVFIIKKYKTILPGHPQTRLRLSVSCSEMYLLTANIKLQSFLVLYESLALLIC